MSSSTPHPVADTGERGLAEFYLQVRQRTVALCETLSAEDTVVQSMADVSPTKWHLAHVTWFFERFVLQPHLRAWEPFHPGYDHLFNSYYYTVGQMFQRPRRGLLSRPTLGEVMRYREFVDARVLALLADPGRDAALAGLVTLGLHHEQQHQELLLTDIKHVFSVNPLRPVFRESAPWAPARTSPTAMTFVPGPDGVIACGATPDDAGFCFDNETPRHDVLVRPHALASRPVTNGEYLEFVRDGAYREPSLWLADGWTRLQEDGWDRPLYWSADLSSEFTLNGQVELDAHAPVCHLSFYEADAFARWAGKRLPTEFELELALARAPRQGGHFADDEQFHPRPAGAAGAAGGRLPQGVPPASAPAAGPAVASGARGAVGAAGAGSRSEEDAPLLLQQLYGDVWEWTASPYTAYPGFVPLAGSLGEYNGKFMCSQLVLRGGSCATPRGHVRATYRNFFYPDARWQFSGVRLAQDL